MRRQTKVFRMDKRTVIQSSNIVEILFSLIATCEDSQFLVLDVGTISDQSCTSSTGFGVAEDLFQDRGLCIKMYLWCRSCLPVESVTSCRRLRSASTGCVELPRVLTSTGQRSFSFHGPTVWNSLPSALRDGSLSLNTFSWQLKTYLFGQ